MIYIKDVVGYEGLYAVTSCGKVWSYYSKKFLQQQIDNNGYLRVSLSKNGKSSTFKVHRLVAQAYVPNVNNKPQVSHKDECKIHNWINNLEWATSEENNNMPLRKQRGSDSHKGEKNSFYGKNHSEDTKIAISKSRKCKYSGKDNPNYGKIHSQEVRDKISKSRKGKYGGEKNPMYGRTGYSNPNSKPVYCVQLNRIFANSRDAERELSISASSILANCNGQRKSAGKHPITGEKLVWEKYNNTK